MITQQNKFLDAANKEAIKRYPYGHDAVSMQTSLAMGMQEAFTDGAEFMLELIAADIREQAQQFSNEQNNKTND